MSEVLPSATRMNAGEKPPWPKPTCSFIATFVRLKPAQGNIERHRSIGGIQGGQPVPKPEAVPGRPRPGSATEAGRTALRTTRAAARSWPATATTSPPARRPGGEAAWAAPPSRRRRRAARTAPTATPGPAPRTAPSGACCAAGALCGGAWLALRTHVSEPA